MKMCLNKHTKTKNEQNTIEIYQNTLKAVKQLAEVCDSDSCFGETDFEGILSSPIPIHRVLGDSHGALFGQGCLKAGRISRKR